MSKEELTFINKRIDHAIEMMCAYFDVGDIAAARDWADKMRDLVRERNGDA